MVTDLTSSVEFYRDIIGLTLDQVNDSNVEFDTGESTLVLEEDFDGDVLDDFGLTRPSDPRGEGVIVALDVDTPEDVDAIVDRVADAAFSVNMQPRDVPWGRRMALVEDPDGYVVELSAPN